MSYGIPKIRELVEKSIGDALMCREVLATLDEVVKERDDLRLALGARNTEVELALLEPLDIAARAFDIIAKEPKRIDHIPSHVSPPTDGIVYCTINRQHFRVPCGHYTGAAIRGWHEPPISGDRDLWLTVPGGPDEQYGEVDEYLFDRSGTRWFDTPRFINASSDSAEPTLHTHLSGTLPPYEHSHVHSILEVDCVSCWYGVAKDETLARIAAEKSLATAEHRIEELTAERDKWRMEADEQTAESARRAGALMSANSQVWAAESTVAALSAQVEAYRGLETAARECVDAAKDLRKYVSPDSGCGYFTYKRIWDSSMQAETHFVHALAALSDKPHVCGCGLPLIAKGDWCTGGHSQKPPSAALSDKEETKGE